MVTLKMATAYVNGANDYRLLDAQTGFLRGCLKFSITPIIYAHPLEDEIGRPKFGDILRLARRHSVSGLTLWCNSDCELIEDPRVHLADNGCCYGFNRRELPDGEICRGVDMYAIPNDLWDDYLSKDIPDMFVGASMIDWWITRACQKLGRYRGGSVIMNHPRHPPAAVTSTLLNKYNEGNFRQWATRNSVDQGLQ